MEEYLAVARALLSRGLSLQFHMCGRDIHVCYAYVTLVLSVLLGWIFARMYSAKAGPSVEYPLWESLRSS